VRIVPRERLGTILAAVPGVPRVVAGGNYATPWSALAVLDAAVAEYRLFMLNAQPGVPDRDGVVLESPFVGPGVRGRPGLRYFPAAASASGRRCSAMESRPTQGGRAGSRP